MRKILKINEGWQFVKDCADPAVTEGAVAVTLPHTWNNEDGYDGGTYFRGSCVYSKNINKDELGAGNHYLEIRGANSSADVYLNGKHLAHHDGGYSTWRVNLTADLHEGDNALAIVVDNAPNETVYPQMADFTFYGGLYRDVYIVTVADNHFDLDYFGAPGIKITPEICGKDAKVEVEVYTTELAAGQQIAYTLYDKEGNELDKTVSSDKKVVFEIKGVHLWHGRRDPYLYSCKAEIVDGDEVIDNVSSRFGCRTFNIDPERGFFLNGEEYPLRGVSRHQDRLGFGNALLPEHHKEDMEFIYEVGCTTIRLAHYQHDQYFYDLCDEYGMVIWAEIPYISRHMPTGRANTISQMTELVAQNYNHPSIVVWGLSNEITISGSNPDLIENHNILNDLCHKMDNTRRTTIAAVSMCKIDDPYIQIPDVVSYNHYFGWYGGETDMNGPWFDNFHKTYPNIPIGCSEYGCEALNWHTSDPKQGDYTEEYQAYYHEELIKQLYSRPYMWSTHVWNMFDFGADARAEGGENGQNHKGLMTMDRKYKKDSFYAYKAWLRTAEEAPVLHICGKRYVDRVEDVTKVTVYSNFPEVELYVNGELLEKQSSDNHFFYFNVPNVGTSTLTAKAGGHTDESTINKVDTFNEAYRLVEKGAILNWFDIDTPEGRYSLNDKLGDIMLSLRGKLWFFKLMAGVIIKMKSGKKKGGQKEEKKEGGFSIDPSMFNNLMAMMSSFTILRMSSMMGMANISFTKDQLLKMNKQLNRIRKPKSLRK